MNALFDSFLGKTTQVDDDETLPLLVSLLQSVPSHLKHGCIATIAKRKLTHASSAELCSLFEALVAYLADVADVRRAGNRDDLLELFTICSEPVFASHGTLCITWQSNALINVMYVLRHNALLLIEFADSFSHFSSNTSVCSMLHVFFSLYPFESHVSVDDLILTSTIRRLSSEDADVRALLLDHSQMPVKCVFSAVHTVMNEDVEWLASLVHADPEHANERLHEQLELLSDKTLDAIAQIAFENTQCQTWTTYVYKLLGLRPIRVRLQHNEQFCNRLVVMEMNFTSQLHRLCARHAITFIRGADSRILDELYKTHKSEYEGHQHALLVCCLGIHGTVDPLLCHADAVVRLLETSWYDDTLDMLFAESLKTLFATLPTMQTLMCIRTVLGTDSYSSAAQIESQFKHVVRAFLDVAGKECTEAFAFHRHILEYALHACELYGASDDTVSALRDALNNAPVHCSIVLNDYQFLTCPISRDLLRWGVVCSDTYTYEFEYILKMRKMKDGASLTSPMTREPMTHLCFNRGLAHAMEELVKQHVTTSCV